MAFCVVELLRAVLRRRGRLPQSLTERVACFREVLHANNAALGHLANIQEVLAGERSASAADVRKMVAGVTVQTYRMVVQLNRLTRDRFTALLPLFERIRKQVAAHVEAGRFLGEVLPVLDLAGLESEHADVVGQKSALLGVAGRAVGGAVPPGFTTTVAAYRRFLGQDGLDARIAGIVAGLAGNDVAGSFAAASRIATLIETTGVPDDLAEAIQSAVRRLERGGHTHFAVRSSALQEGGLSVSFAGQYRSLLNVDASSVVDAFRQVVASKYSAQAITYRLERGFDDDEVAMCCCVIPMIDAVSAGVLYSACTTEQGEVTLIQGVRGLGLAAVDGSVRPESIEIARSTARVALRRPAGQSFELRCAPAGGTERAPRTGTDTILDDAAALRLARLAWRVEAAVGAAVDLEWAIDPDGKPWVLQVRPQPVHKDAVGRPTRTPVAGQRVLLIGGARASGGAASGPVHLIARDLDLLSCPQGAVAVVPEASPRLAVVLPRLAGLVAEMGDVTGHLATVAREIGVPAILGSEHATRALAGAGVVTVDADACCVYSGRVDEALARSQTVRQARCRAEHVERLALAAELIVPLTVIGRMAGARSVHRCRTVHDVIRVCHQATVEALFDIGDRRLREGGLRRLMSDVPIDCRLIDLGGGLRAGIGPGDVTLDDVRSLPLRALWRGLTDVRLRWRMTRPVSVRGFASALVNYNFDEDGRVRAMGEPSYAFVTDRYLNLNSRIGYHFSTVDASISGEIESNYASFRFVGGSTGVDQRCRRATLIERVLAARGFETDRCADLVNARIRYLEPAEMEEALVVVGLLSGYVNHLDMMLTSDAMVDRFEREFLAGNVGYRGDDGALG